MKSKFLMVVLKIKSSHKFIDMKKQKISLIKVEKKVFLNYLKANKYCADVFIIN